MDSNAFSLYRIIILFIVVIMGIIGILFLIGTFNASFRDKFIVRKQKLFLLNGKKISPQSKIFRKSKKKQFTIRSKFMVFCFFLISLISLGSGHIVGHRFIKLVKTNLTDDLNNRILILKESISKALEYYMPARRITEMEQICSIGDFLPEVKSITILGPNFISMDMNDDANFDYVWYSTNPNIGEVVDEYDQGFGSMKYVDENSDFFNQIISDSDKTITENLYPLVLQQEYKAQQLLKLAENLENYDVSALTTLQEEYFDLENQISVRLVEYADRFSGYIPDFNSSSLNDENEDYTFYQPIFYRNSNGKHYVHGIILIDFSTSSFRQIVKDERLRIQNVSIIFALVASIVALIGTYIMTSVITNPLKTLEDHLKHVGLVKDKTKLDKMEVRIKSKDEIGNLASIVNEMTKMLGAAAKEEQLLIDAKSVQQAFLPLVTTQSGAKRNVAFQKTESIEVFGYFEGAATVSGDYFDYKRLDKEWYVVVKCDASGHGFAAAIIMTIIATLFRNYFSHWTYEKNGIGINHFVNQVNQFISSLNIDGRFASMLVCLINSKTGELYMCNAGDNLVHIYDSTLRKVKTIELFSSPVVGPFNPVLINQMGGFKVEKIVLKPGDLLLLYTDGIEEAFRTCRDRNYDVIQIEGDIPGTLKPKQEVFGQRNILKVIEAVLNQEVFVLEKANNPNETEVLEFDFTTCPGTTEDVVTAIAAVEKVFRMYKPTTVLKTDYISVDKQIDHFLKKYFKLYNEYCLNKVENTEDYVFSNYVDYEYLMEDEQKDDLTFVVVKYR